MRIVSVLAALALAVPAAPASAQSSGLTRAAEVKLEGCKVNKPAGQRVFADCNSKEKAVELAQKIKSVAGNVKVDQTGCSYSVKEVGKVEFCSVLVR